MTQFGRALAELNIEIICANSSQAKGRVERVSRTLQDRLVKELRLAKVRTRTSRRYVTTWKSMAALWLSTPTNTPSSAS